MLDARVLSHVIAKLPTAEPSTSTRAGGIPILAETLNSRRKLTLASDA